MGYGIKRILTQTHLIEGLDYNHLLTLKSKVDEYSPRSEEGGLNQRLVTKILDAMIEMAAPEVQQLVSATVARKIADSSFVLEIHSREPSFTKKVDSSEYVEIVKDEAEISADRITISKRLISKKEIQNLSRHRRVFFRSLRSISLPGGLLTLGNGQYLMPLSFLERSRGMIEAYMIKREELLNEFQNNYESIKETAKERLGKLFDPMDYPPFEMIRACYSVEYKFVSNRVPEEFKKISEEIYAAEKQRILEECAPTAGLIQDFLRSQFIELNAHMVDRLGVDEDTGKKKKFSESSLDKMRDFIRTFSDMNLTGDVELSKLVKQAEGIIEGVDVAKIRSDDEFRAELKASFDTVKNLTDKLVVVKKRKVILDE
jgi:hypothetical protein